MDNFKCSICLSLLIKPVTLPCRHEFCLACLERNVDNGVLQCPLCRLRISTWLRRARNNGDSLVNQVRWKQIRKKFRRQVHQLMKAQEEDDPAVISSTGTSDLQPLNSKPVVMLSKPGEIQQEYQEELKKVQEEIAKERKAEEEASMNFIQELLREERESYKTRAELQMVAMRDAKLARKLSSEGREMDESMIDEMYQEIVSEEDKDATSTGISDYFPRRYETRSSAAHQEADRSVQRSSCSRSNSVRKRKRNAATNSDRPAAKRSCRRRTQEN